MLYQRYSNPVMLLDQMLQTGQFYEFIMEFIKIRNEERDEQTAWEFYLHRVFDKSFNEFMAETAPTPEPEATESNIEATVKHSYEMMENFHPE